MLAFIPVLCPDCQSDNIFKHGFSSDRKYRFRCENSDYRGVRDTARVLKVSTTTLTNELKRTKKSRHQSNQIVYDKLFLLIKKQKA